MSDAELVPAPEAAPPAKTEGTPAPDALPISVDYAVGLEPAEVVERLAAEPDVGAYTSQGMPDYGRPDLDHGYTVELTSDTEFRIHVGPPAARGQTGTGMRRLLYLRGIIEPSESGSKVQLRFSYGRPRWALQRWVGFLLTFSLGLTWVFIGGGDFALRVGFFTMFVLFTAPVVAHDLMSGRRLREQKLSLLALAERVLGPEALADGRPTPYRRGTAPNRVLS